MDLRGAPARDFEAIRQSLQATPPYMVMMRHDDDSLNDEALKTLCTDQATRVAISYLTLEVVAQSRI